MTNTRIEIEQAPYKLRPRGSRTYEVVLGDEVIGELTAFRRMVGRQQQVQYVVRSANGGMLGVRITVDDAADLAYTRHVELDGTGTGLVVAGDGLWPREVEFIARLLVRGALTYEHAVNALSLWRELHGLDSMPFLLIGELLNQAARKVAGL